MKKEMNVIDLFCGAGGLSTGFKQAGFNVLLGIDNAKAALQTFKINHKNSEIMLGDITKISKKDIIQKIGNKRIDILVGGPPCQGFSMAGKRNPKDPRNSLIKHYLRLAAEIKPKIFIIENVSGLLSMRTSKGGRIVDIIRKMAEKSGYFISEQILNAKDYGVPQKRKRVILVGSRKKDFNLSLIKTKKMSVKDVLLPKQEVDKRYFYSMKLIKGFKRREKINKKLRRGFGWQFLDLNGPSYTISARYYKDGAEALIKYSDTEIRKLTPEECARIQSFPKDYKFTGGKVNIYRQIGNAVPPKLGFAIAKAIVQSEYGR